MLANWVKETTTTTGTGTISLGGAASADVLPFSSQVPSGTVVTVSILSGSNREIRDVLATSGAPWTLAWVKTHETLIGGIFSNANVPMSLAGTSTVSIVASAEEFNVAPVRFISPQNYLSNLADIASAGTQLTVRLRMPFYIGSGDVSTLIPSLNGWYFTNVDAINYTNAFTIVKMAIELDGATTSVPVTFAGGRTKTINPGDVDIQADALLASAFGLSVIPRNTLMWVRMDYSVNTTGQYFPQGKFNFQQSGYPATVGLAIDPSTFNGGVVDSYGVLGLGSNAAAWSSFIYPLTPLILGTFAQGDPATIIGIGDSITAGTYGQLNNGALNVTNGGFMLGLGDSTSSTDFVGGANFGAGYATGTNWSNTNKAKPQAFLKYATHAVEEMGVNNFLSTPNPLATAQGYSISLWSMCFSAGIKTIIRPHLTPATLADGVTLYNSLWASGGAARLFNAWLDGLTTPNVIVINNNSLRAGINGDAYYQWVNATYTVEGIHPNNLGVPYESIDYRDAFQIQPLNTRTSDTRYTQLNKIGAAPVALTVGASPYAYTAPIGGAVTITGGTVSSVTLTRAGTLVLSLASTGEQLHVRAGDVVTVTYTAVPSIYLLGD